MPGQQREYVGDFKKTHNFRPILSVAKHILQGKSLARALLDLAITGHEIGGKILDLGSASASPSYLKYLQVSPNSEVIFSDLQGKEGVISLNVEQPFPLPDESFDIVLSFNLFEHVYNFHVAPPEIFRILRKGGRAFVSTPFLYDYHPDPEDFFRFTDKAILRLWKDAGFRCISIEVIGEGLITNFATKLPQLILPGWAQSWLSALLYLITSPIDRLLALIPRRSGITLPERFALEYLAICSKSSNEV